MKIIQAPTSNFTKGRKQKKVIAIVNHITAGSFPGCLEWMKNPRAKASAHYLVNKVGEVYQLVKDEDTSWACGIANHPNWPLYDGSNPNYYVINIEHEGNDGSLTDAQYQATLELQTILVKKFNIPVDIDHIIGHYRIDSIDRPNCPGPKFPWARLLEDLEEEVSDLKEISININNEVIKGLLIKNTTYIPVREVMQRLGKKVVWDQETQTVTIK